MKSQLNIIKLNKTKVHKEKINKVHLNLVELNTIDLNKEDKKYFREKNRSYIDGGDYYRKRSV